MQSKKKAKKGLHEKSINESNRTKGGTDDGMDTPPSRSPRRNEEAEISPDEIPAANQEDKMLVGNQEEREKKVGSVEDKKLSNSQTTSLAAATLTTNLQHQPYVINPPGAFAIDNSDCFAGTTVENADASSPPPVSYHVFYPLLGEDPNNLIVATVVRTSIVSSPPTIHSSTRNTFRQLMKD
jgi:hypothetical protein